MWLMNIFCGNKCVIEEGKKVKDRNNSYKHQDPSTETPVGFNIYSSLDRNWSFRLENMYFIQRVKGATVYAARMIMITAVTIIIIIIQEVCLSPQKSHTD